MLLILSLKYLHCEPKKSSRSACSISFSSTSYVVRTEWAVVFPGLQFKVIKVNFEVKTPPKYMWDDYIASFLYFYWMFLDIWCISLCDAIDRKYFNIFGTCIFIVKQGKNSCEPITSRNISRQFINLDSYLKLESEFGRVLCCKKRHLVHTSGPRRRASPSLMIWNVSEVNYDAKYRYPKTWSIIVSVLLVLMYNWQNSSLISTIASEVVILKAKTWMFNVQ